MNVSEYIVKYLKANGVMHFFGYQGTMITHFVDAIYREEGVENHSCYNEQGASFAACGYAKASGKLAVAYSTSGPGAINLLQGIADAYYDSTPVIFITGQLNLYEYSSVKGLRQQGFQETNVIEITKSLTKYNAFIDKPIRIIEELPKAVEVAMSGRKGPVVIDIPMDMQHTEIPLDETELQKNIGKSLSDNLLRAEDAYSTDFSEGYNIEMIAHYIISEIEKSSRPVFLLGNGISKDSETRMILNEMIRELKIPVLTSLLAIDLISEESGLNFGYMGSSYGQRSGNIIANKKTDLIISLGCRLCTRQTGVHQDKFAQSAKIVRIDVDPAELERKLHEDVCFRADVNLVIRELKKYKLKKDYDNWISVCREIKQETTQFDSTLKSRYPNKFVEAISDTIQEPLIAVADVGQNMMWTAQSFKINAGQQVLFSGAHGSMGFALPAAIGAYYGSGKPVLCLSGDGGFQMNIQELQWVYREQIPMRIFVFNNNSLGMICQVQDAYMEGRRIGTSHQGGFVSPNFSKIAEAYGIKSYRVDNLESFENVLQAINDIDDSPCLVEIVFHEDTEAQPKTFFGEEINNQRPYLPKDVYERIMNL